MVFLMCGASTLLWGKKMENVKFPPETKDGSASGDGTNADVVHHSVHHLIDSLSTALKCRIKVKEAKISTTLNARPAVLSIFGKRENRKYIIRVNNNPHFKGIRNHDVPLPARDGLWVHELMHIKDYQSRSTWGILKRAAQYLTVSGRKVFEHEIDRMVVRQGYGDALYQWANFIMFESDASESYKAYKQSVYLTPAQIMVEMGRKPYLGND